MSEEIGEGDHPSLKIEEEDGLDWIRCPDCGHILYYLGMRNLNAFWSVHLNRAFEPPEEFQKALRKGRGFWCANCRKFISLEEFQDIDSHSIEQLMGKLKHLSEEEVDQFAFLLDANIRNRTESSSDISDDDSEEVQESLPEDEGDEEGGEKEDEVRSGLLIEVDDPPAVISMDLVGFPCHEPLENPTIEQLWWYRSVDSEKFGIHLNVQAFEKLISEEGRVPEVAFTQGYLHEYLHHIVDSWCSEGEVSRKLTNAYGKQRRREVIQGKRPFLLMEEVLANAFSHGGMRWEFKFPKPSAKSSYDLWPSLMEFRKPKADGKLDWKTASATNSILNIVGIDEYRWKELSIIVALQYLLEDHTVDHSMPRDGLTLNELRFFPWFSHELESKLPKNEYFNTNDGFSFFGRDSLTKIPFHTHGKSIGTINYKDLVSLMENNAPTEFSPDSADIVPQ